MKKNICLAIAVCLILLTGCSSSTPSNREIKEIVYALYFREASVLDKEACEVSESMASAGHANVWLVKYRLVSSDKPNSIAITENSTGDWEIYTGSYQKGRCPQ